MAKPDLGAVAPSPAGLKEALRYGIVANQREGFRASSGQALLGIEAGLYGPAHLMPAPAVPAFDAQRVGTIGEPLEVEFLSADRRALRIGAVRVGGADAAEFQLGGDGCGAATLTRGESCTVSVAFSPTGRAGEREAWLELTLDGIAAPVTVPLAAIATVPVKGGEGPPSELPTEPDRAVPAPAAAGSAATLGGTRAIGRDRVAALATLTCHADVGCQVKVPRRLRVTIAGRHYAAWVLAPADLGPGEGAALSVRLSPRAASALLGTAAIVRVRVWLGADGQFEVEEIEARVVGAVPPSALANRRLSPSLRAGASAEKKETAR